MKRVLICAAVCLVASALCFGQAEEPKSYVVNGGFEEMAKAKLAGWHLYFYPKREGEDINTHLQASTEQAQTGKQSLKIAVPAPLKPLDEKQKNVRVYFNGGISREVVKLAGKTLVFSACIYVPEGSTPQPVALRLRQWGPKTEEKGTFKGDLAGLTLRGKPGEWVKVQKEAVLKVEDLTHMDMQCSVTASGKPVLQYIDDVRLEVKPAE